MFSYLFVLKLIRRIDRLADVDINVKAFKNGFEKTKYAGDTEDALAAEKAKMDSRANENRKKIETEDLAE